jgi:flagellar hook-length control protein FliK
VDASANGAGSESLSPPPDQYAERVEAARDAEAARSVEAGRDAEAARNAAEEEEGPGVSSSRTTTALAVEAAALVHVNAEAGSKAPSDSAGAEGPGEDVPPQDEGVRSFSIRKRGAEDQVRDGDLQPVPGLAGAPDEAAGEIAAETAGLANDKAAALVAADAEAAGKVPDGSAGNEAAVDAGLRSRVSRENRRTETRDPAETTETGSAKTAEGESPSGEDSRLSARDLAKAENPAEAPEPGPELRAQFRAEIQGPELRTPAPEHTGTRIVAAAGEEQGRPVDRTERGGENRRSGRKRPVVELRDYRELPPSQSPAGTSETKLHPDTSRTAPVVELGGQAEPGGRAEPGVPVELGRREGAFEELLARELRQTVNNDIVRHAQVILRDGGEGLIRLSLKPESLGNVKIRLELTENKIAGRVIVESGEALRAFERELASLEQAFRDSGYESAELSAFLAQDNGGRERDESSPRFAANRAASRYDDSLEKTSPSAPEDIGAGFWPGTGPISINMLV